MEGVKHIVECHCMLPQYKSIPSTIYHKFLVFSIIDDGDTVIPKYAECNNCGVIHRVFDICKSEIVAGKDESKAIITKEDIVPFLPKVIVEILDSYSTDLVAYEEAKFIMDNQKWLSSIILSKEICKEEIIGKKFIFENKNKFKIEDFAYRIYVE